MQSMMGDVCAASEPLVEQLGPVAANWIQLELQRLSRDVLLLDRATSRAGQKLRVGLLPHLKGKGSEVAPPHEARTRLLCAGAAGAAAAGSDPAGGGRRADPKASSGPREQLHRPKLFKGRPPPNKPSHALPSVRHRVSINANSRVSWRQAGSAPETMAT